MKVDCTLARIGRYDVFLDRVRSACVTSAVGWEPVGCCGDHPIEVPSHAVSVLSKTNSPIEHLSDLLFAGSRRGPKAKLKHVECVCRYRP